MIEGIAKPLVITNVHGPTYYDPSSRLQKPACSLRVDARAFVPSWPPLPAAPRSPQSRSRLALKVATDAYVSAVAASGAATAAARVVSPMQSSLAAHHRIRALQLGQPSFHSINPASTAGKTANDPVQRVTTQSTKPASYRRPPPLKKDNINTTNSSSRKRVTEKRRGRCCDQANPLPSSFPSTTTTNSSTKPSLAEMELAIARACRT